MAEQSLSDKFAIAAQKISGNMDINVAQAETRNLCDKFELLWDMARDKQEKVDLASRLTSVLYQVAMQIKTQPNAMAIDSSMGMSIKMFNTLKAHDPDYVTSSNLSNLFKSEATVLTGAAKQQLYDLPRNALLRAADALTLMAGASRAPAPNTPAPGTPKP